MKGLRNLSTRQKVFIGGFAVVAVAFVAADVTNQFDVMSGDGFGDLSAMLVVGWILYFIPALIAAHRQHPQLLPIFALNLLLGWTVVGWVAALIWGLVRSAEPAAATGAPRSQLEELERLTALRDRGALSDEEFQDQKRRILG